MLPSDASGSSVSLLSCACCHDLGHLRTRGFFLLLAGRQLHAATEYRAIFHADAPADDIAGKRAFAADIHAIAALDIARDLAHNDNFSCRNVGCNYAIPSHSHTVIFE